MQIGELLVMQGLITEEQLANALELQAQTPQKLGDILLEQGLITEQHLVEVLEFQLGVPIIRLSEFVLDKEIVELISESLARKHWMIPVDIKGDKLRVAMVDPQNQVAIRDIQNATDLKIQPVLATRTEIEQAIVRYYVVDESLEIVENVLQSFIKGKATDMHLDFQESGLNVIYRTGGLLRTNQAFSKEIGESVIKRIKISANLDPSDRHRPQHGKMSVQLGSDSVELLVSTLHAIHGESMVISRAQSLDQFVRLDDLDLYEENVQQLTRALGKQHGMVLIAGVSEPSRISTLHYMLGQIKQRGQDNKKIIAIEESVTRIVDGVIQVETNESIGLTYPHMLREALRQDPNVIMLGDMWNPETVLLAVRAALSGRLILGGMYGNSVQDMLSQLSSIGINSYWSASSINCLVAQRWVKRVCSKCAQSHPVSDEEMKHFEAYNLHLEENQSTKSRMSSLRSFFFKQISGKIAVVKGSGCSACGNTGYKGLVPLHEVLTIDETIQKWVVEHRPAAELAHYLKLIGFKSLFYDGLLKAREGITTMEEVMKLKEPELKAIKKPS